MSSRKRNCPNEDPNSSKRTAVQPLKDITNGPNESQVRKPTTRLSARTQEDRNTSIPVPQPSHSIPFPMPISQNPSLLVPPQTYPAQTQTTPIGVFVIRPINQIHGFEPYIPEPEEPLTPFVHDDIDLINGSNDPSWMTAYIQEIYSYLRSRELFFNPINPFYLQTQNNTTQHPEITSEMRKVLINWLHEVSTEFLLKGETLFLTVNYLDRFLSRTHNIARTRFQLVGVTCLFIAVKYEQIVPITLEQLVHLTAETYSREELVGMETEILNTLNFELTVPTVKAFLSRFIKASRFDPTRTFHANFLAELSLLKYEMIRFPPSVIAASCVYLTLVTSGRQWTPTLAYYSQCSPQNCKNSQLFVECVTELHHFWFSERFQEGNSVFEKYSLPQFHSVAQIEPHN